MMDFPLAIPVIIRRAEALFRHKTIATRLPDRSIARATYGEMLDRVRRLAVALRTLGVRPGDRVATLAWASQAHLEAYLAIPALGAVLHTLNLRLHHDEVVSPVLRAWKVFDRTDLGPAGEKAREELAVFLEGLDAQATRFVESRERARARAAAKS